MKMALPYLILTCFLLTVSTPSLAVTFTFDNVTHNNAEDAATGEAQLLLDVTDGENNQVLFTFSNTGSENSSICDIYFDDGTPLMSFTEFSSTTGTVVFSEGSNSGDLPGWNDSAFESDYSYDSDPEVQPSGINPGETLGILFDLNLMDGTEQYYSFDDVISAIQNGSMLVGLHVQGFDSNGSEGFINAPPNPVPEPATMLLFGTGLVGLAGVSRKKIMKRG